MTQSNRVSETRKKKIETVEKLTEKLKSAKSVVFTDYRGLTHKQLEALRKTLAQVNAEFTVAKNTLLQRALTASNLQPATDNQQLTGPTAIISAYDDEISPLRKLSQFMKETGLPAVKFGLFNNQYLQANEVIRLSRIPSKDILLSQVIGRIIAPLYGLHYTLSWNMRKLVFAIEEIKRKKDN